MHRRSVLAALAGLPLMAPGLGRAHTAKPKHGGVVREAGDLSFELVPKDDGASLFVEDHGKPFPSAGMTGKLTVLNGKDTTEARLEPAGGNRLEAKGVQVGKGSRAVAVLTTAQKRTLTVRFAFR